MAASPNSSSLSGGSELPRPAYFGGLSKPYIRWWWLTGPFVERDMVRQLDWIRDNGFGGVEIAWIAPHWLGWRPPPPRWLSAEWARLVVRAAEFAAERGLGCDLTFGSCWPFGGSHVRESEASQCFGGLSHQRLRGSWEDADDAECLIVNHLSHEALEAYARQLLPAFVPAIQPGRTALFCDSLQLDTNGLWDDRLWDVFAGRFGYRLEPYAEQIDSHPDVRYDYRKLIAETMTREFYAAFTELCHGVGAFSRVQCHGSPTDLLAAYSSVDIPESETLLFEPHFSRIAASAAVLSGKPVVSCETFTCMHGFSHLADFRLYPLWKNEDIHDLKLLADSVIANGVNQIVWHGMPFHTPGDGIEFYAGTHVGPDSGFVASIPAFNRYLSDVCTVMQSGSPYTSLAVYLPNEDNWMEGRIPDDERTPGASHRWEMRHVRPPAETSGFHPVWVSCPFLQNAVVANKRMRIGECDFQALYVDCTWLDNESLHEISRLATEGLPVVLTKRPKQPGRRPAASYEERVEELLSLDNVVSGMPATGIKPLIHGDPIPPYWARCVNQDVYVFLAHPAAGDIRFPMRRGQATEAAPVEIDLELTWGGHSKRITVELESHTSKVLVLNPKGQLAVKTWRI